MDQPFHIVLSTDAEILGGTSFFSVSMALPHLLAVMRGIPDRFHLAIFFLMRDSLSGLSFFQEFANCGLAFPSDPACSLAAVFLFILHATSQFEGVNADVLEELGVLVERGRGTLLKPTPPFHIAIKEGGIADVVL